MSVSVLPYSVDDIHRILDKPAAPNFIILEGQHAFAVVRPSKEVEIRSFKSVLGMFLGVCLKSLADIEARHVDDFPLIEGIIDKMILDNAYSLSEAEAKLMTAIVRSIDALINGDVVSLDDVVICTGDCVPPVSVEAFCESRVGEEGVVIDLCDSDTGDLDRTKHRAAKRMVAQQEQEIAELKLKVFSTHFNTDVYCLMCLFCSV
jgi:hypothetical protein